MRKEGVTVKDKLNARQKKFAEFYAQSGNAARSAIKAGYSEKYAGQNADKLLKNTNVAEYIKQLSEVEQDKRIMTAKERQALLSDIAKDDTKCTSDRIKAVDTLNKMTGEYITNIKAELNTNFNNPFAELSTEDLKKLIADE